MPQQRRLGRPAHQDQLLVGQHHHAGEGREPHPQVNESLVARLIVIYRYRARRATRAPPLRRRERAAAHFGISSFFSSPFPFFAPFSLSSLSLFFFFTGTSDDA